MERLLWLTWPTVLINGKVQQLNKDRTGKDADPTGMKIQADQQKYQQKKKGKRNGQENEKAVLINFGLDTS